MSTSRNDSTILGPEVKEALDRRNQKAYAESVEDWNQFNDDNRILADWAVAHIDELYRLRLICSDLTKKYDEMTEKALFTESDLRQAQAILSLGALGVLDSEMLALGIAGAKRDNNDNATQ